MVTCRSQTKYMNAQSFNSFRIVFWDVRWTSDWRRGFVQEDLTDHTLTRFPTVILGYPLEFRLVTLALFKTALLTTLMVRFPTVMLSMSLSSWSLSGEESRLDSELVSVGRGPQLPNAVTLNTVPHVVSLNHKPFRCYLITVILLCCES